MQIADTNSGVRIRGATPADVDFTLQAEPLDVEAAPATSETITVKDTVYRDETTALVDHVATVTAVGAPQPPVFSSTDTNVLTVELATGVVSLVFDGTAGVLAKLPLLTKRIDVSVFQTGGDYTRTFISRVPGSLAAYLDNERATRTGSITPTDTKRNIYLARNYSAQTCTLNPDCVLFNVDMSPFSILNSWNQTNGRGGGTLVSPRHLIAADHYAPLNVGHTALFASHTGQVYARTVSAKQKVGTSDLRVCLLNSDLPSDIKFAKVMPDDWATKLPGSRIPCYYSNQFKQVFVGYVNLTTGNWTISGYQNGTETPEPWYANVVDGDSGSPAFFIVNGEMVLIGPTHFYGPAGSAVTGMNAEVNTVMTALGGGYQLTVADLSSFPNYP